MVIFSSSSIISDAKCLQLCVWNAGVKQALVGDISGFCKSYQRIHLPHIHPTVPYPPTTSIHPVAPRWLRLKLMRHFLHGCTGHWLQLFLASKTVAVPWIICFPHSTACVWVYPVPAQIPQWLQQDVAHWVPQSTAGALPWSVLGRKMGSRTLCSCWQCCTSHTHTSAWTDCPHEWDSSPRSPTRHCHCPKELPAGVWRSKPTPCPESHIRHKRHSHSRIGFYEPFINTVHSFGAQNYSVSSWLSHSSGGLIINGPVKQYTACCILIQ